MAQHRRSGTDYSAGCRCESCRKANTRRANMRRSARMALRVEVDGVPVAQGQPHGTYSTYTNWGCRCSECVQAGAEYRAANRG